MTVTVRNNRAPTIHDLAVAVGVHKSTVSLALSGKGTISAATRQKVLTTARTLGYRPNPLAQRLASSISSGLVCILSNPLDCGLGTQKLVTIEDELGARSLEVPLHTFAGPARHGPESNEESPSAKMRQICQMRPRAVVCAGPVIHPADLAELEAYQEYGGIVVSYDVPAPLNCDQIIFDREDNAYQAARHLLLQGHRSIGIAMSTPPAWSPEARSLPSTSRLKGFRRALDEFGAPQRDEWVFFHDGTYEDGGQELARRFLAMRERPTGLCIVNDYSAMAFMVEALRAGVRVPQEVSVIAHDNQRITELCPVPMTSVSHPAEAIARTVVRMLLERIDGFDGPPRTEIIRGELVTRRSVAAPPG